ncbi:MAG: hypothetical protein H7101_08860 [Deinococcales bacterium]|nr:hypothetical protein [Chitinophagaceae bacterium]
MLTKNDIEKYFIAEKQESLLFIILGLVAIVLAALFLFVYKSQFFKGAATPLIIIGLIQVVVGYTVYNKSDADRMRMVYAYDMNPTNIKTVEIPRMQKVNNNFVIYKWIEIGLLVTGLLVVLYHQFSDSGLTKNSNTNVFIYGLAFALSVLIVIMLTADFFAKKRAIIYSKQLESFVYNNKIP